MPKKNEIIIGNYRIKRQIAEGGFGRVYEAEHIILGEKACLKQNLNISAPDAELLKQEAKLLWNLNHYSLPSMKDFFQAPDGSYIMVMNFIEGQNLEEIVKGKGPIHAEDVCWITQRLLNALHYLHFNGVVHSDVKPQNVIVQPKVHNAILVDYGLSSLKPTRATQPKGYTEAFAAPEILQGKPPIPESDFYGLGLVMMYALGGDPFAKTHYPNTPKQIQEFIDSLICYDPTQRHSWDKTDLVSRLSDIRLEVFGRRYST